MNDLSPFEQRVVLLLRQLDPFEVVEIKRDGADLLITVKSTIKERFRDEVLKYGHG